MKAKDEYLGWWFIGLFWTFLILLIVGWVLNIIAIFHAHEMTGTLVARVIGTVIAPLGSVLGYF
jgi:hypothetical protein